MADGLSDRGGGEGGRCRVAAVLPSATAVLAVSLPRSGEAEAPSWKQTPQTRQPTELFPAFLPHVPQE